MTDSVADEVREIQERAKEELDDAPVHGIIRAGTLQQWVDTLSSLLHECKVHFGDGGISVSAVEPGNVAMYQDLTLDAAAFEAFDAPGSVVIGVGLERLDELLDPANSNDLCEFFVDMESRKLRLRYRNISQAMALIDPESIKKEPDNPDLDLPNALTITGAQFDDVVTVSDMTSDHLAIEGRPDDEQVVFIAEGDIDDSVIEFGNEEQEIEPNEDKTKVVEQTRALFSVSYWEEIGSPMPDDVPVTLEFGQEFPIRIHYQACDGHLDVHAMVAPRIE